MLLARLFSYADAQRARLGVNYEQIPVNAPVVPVHTYSQDGVMRIQNHIDPVYAPNSKGGPRADSEHYKPASSVVRIDDHGPDRHGESGTKRSIWWRDHSDCTG